MGAESRLRSQDLERYKNKFWENIVIEEASGCWIWVGSISGNGYGKIGIRNGENGLQVIIGAHRYSWIIHYGSIPDKILVLHKCDNPICMNPDHLFLGTNKDNTCDMFAKGRNSNHIPIPLGSILSDSHRKNLSIAKRKRDKREKQNV